MGFFLFTNALESHIILAIVTRIIYILFALGMLAMPMQSAPKKNTETTAPTAQISKKKSKATPQKITVKDRLDLATREIITVDGDTVKTIVIYGAGGTEIYPVKHNCKNLQLVPKDMESKDAKWLNIGIGEAGLIVKCAPYNSKDAHNRTATFYLKGDKKRAVINVVQKPYAQRNDWAITQLICTNQENDGKVITASDTAFFDTGMRFLNITALYEYEGEKSDVELMVRIIDPTGKTLRNSESPKNGSYLLRLPITDTSKSKDGVAKLNLSGWGSQYSGAFQPGRYLVEVFDGKKRKAWLHVNVKKDEGLRVDNVEYGNKEADGTLVGPYGETLDYNTLRYLALRMQYTLPGNKQKKVKVGVKITDSSGKLVVGEKNQKNLTYTYTLTLEPGPHMAEISGWGRAEGGKYPPGDYDVEVYIDGKKMYRGYFNVTQTGKRFLTEPELREFFRKQK